MSNIVNGSAILNPFSPMAFLSPEQAFQLAISRYILVGTLGALLWDIISNLKIEYILLFRHRIRLQTIIYFISKLFTFGYILGTTIFETVPVSWCASSQKALAVLFCVAIPFTSLLFFFRVRAIFSTNPWAIAFFAGLWLAVPAGCLTTLVGITATNIGPTKFCITGNIKPTTGAVAIILLISDTIVFLAITWRLWCNSYARRTIKDGVRVLVYGDYLPAFSRLMLQDGQAYYLTTISVNLLTVIMLYISSPFDSYWPTLMNPNIALMNMMACRIYRNTLFALLNENQMPSIMMRDLGAAGSVISLSLVEISGSGTKQGVNEIPKTAQNRNQTPNDVSFITVTRTVEPIVEDCPGGDGDKNHTDMFRTVQKES